jgi:hypothetical protein
LEVPDGIAWRITGRALTGSAAGYRHTAPATIKRHADKITYKL